MSRSSDQKDAAESFASSGYKKLVTKKQSSRIGVAKTAARNSQRSSLLA